ncbi:MAG: UDP-glucose/GDP-mannose dehydrogenase family protein [Firmicutes bacterium]|nr:UDP-glucose/GDP-mannose dehydrogenase family protein [Bacillota bacterium]
MYKIAVLGTGYVGLTTGIGLANFGSNVLCLDIEEDKISALQEGFMPIYEPGMEAVLKENMKADRLNFSTDIETSIKWADIIFIAVGTPQGPDGTADLTALFKAVETIGKNINGYKIIVTKSTVPVGTNEEIKKRISAVDALSHEFDVVSNPEFLREGKALYDFLHPDRVVIGTDNPRPAEAMRRIYRPLYLNEVPFIFTDFRTAELIKYSSNCFLAMKVAFINEVARLCDAVGGDVQVVAQAVGKDGRIGSKFLHPSPGYGGSCFPKDTEALAAIAREAGSPLGLVEATIASNLKQKLFVVEKIGKRMGDLQGVKIGILGLAFKSETDDMRESASIVIIDELLRRGAVIRAYDPQATGNARRIWGDSIVYGMDEYDAVTGVDGLVILTEWNQFRNLDLERISSLMAGRMFFDFRNIYRRSEVETYGFIYEGIGK